MRPARGVDRLSNLPEPILIHILSMLPDAKEVVRSSVLSTEWRFLWMSVPLSLHFIIPDYFSENIFDFMASTNRELHYWRSCQKIQSFSVSMFRFGDSYVKDVDLWVYFATRLAKVESFTLNTYSWGKEPSYEFPQFAYRNTSLRNLVLSYCKLNPCVSVNWTSLVSLLLMRLNLTDSSMEKILSGCSNLESLRIEECWGSLRLETSSVKLRELIVTCNDYDSGNKALWLEIFAPNMRNLQFLGFCHGIRLRNVASLVTAVFRLYFHFEDGESDLEKELTCLNQLLGSVAHAENLELCPSCIEYMSILELEGWQFPPSSWKFLKLNIAFKLLDFPGICSFLRNISDLETLVIDCFSHEQGDLLSRYTDEDEQSRSFETHNFDCLFLHLKTIKILNFHASLSETKCVLSLAKYLLKNATVLEKFVINARFKGCDDASRDYVKIEEELLSFPRSSPHVSVVFSYPLY